MGGARTGALLLALGVSLTACTSDADSSDADGNPARTPSPSVSASSANQRDGSTSYSYLLTSSCGYGGLFGTYAVVERDGVVESVETVRGNGERPQPRDIPTLRDLVAKAERAKPRAEVRLLVDDEELPIYLRIEKHPASQDTELAPLPAPDFFEALNAVDHAERTSTTLVLTGPEDVLTFERR